MIARRRQAQNRAGIDAGRHFDDIAITGRVHGGLNVVIITNTAAQADGDDAAL